MKCAVDTFLSSSIRWDTVTSDCDLGRVAFKSRCRLSDWNSARLSSAIVRKWVVIFLFISVSALSCPLTIWPGPSVLFTIDMTFDPLVGHNASSVMTQHKEKVTIYQIDNSIVFHLSWGAYSKRCVASIETTPLADSWNYWNINGSLLRRHHMCISFCCRLQCATN